MLHAINADPSVDRSGPCMTEQVLSLYSAINRRRLDEAGSCLSSGWTACLGPGGAVTGPAAAERILGRLLYIFPDLTITPRTVSLRGEAVVVSARVTGTQMGDFIGIPGGRQGLEFETLDFHQVRHGWVARTWIIADWLSIWRQMATSCEQPPRPR